MEITLFIAKVMGWYFVITSLFMLGRRNTLPNLFNEFFADRALLFFVALMTLIFGLLLVVSHNVWVMGWPVVVTIISWLILIGGIIRLAVPDYVIKKGRWWIKNPRALVIAAIVYLIIGLFLLYKAYFH